ARREEPAHPPRAQRVGRLDLPALRTAPHDSIRETFMSDSPKLSRRASSMPASPIRRLAPYAVEARRRGVTVHGLNIGQPDIPTPPAILERYKAYPGTYVPYGPSQGLPEFLEALRGYYAGAGAKLAIEDLFVTTAGSEALLFTMAALCDPGDQ